MRFALLCLALLALIAYGYVAYLVFASETDPEAFRAAGGSWIPGPSGSALAKAADAKVTQALEALSGPAGASAQGLQSYHEQLRAARGLFSRALRARPFDPKSLARLAAVRIALEAPEAEYIPRDALEMTDVAAAMAPDTPGVQAIVGELLLRVGLGERGAARLRRGVELDPELAPRAVRAMRAALLTAEAILSALPEIPEVLVALEGPFFEEGRGERYLSVLEAALLRGELGLVPVYGRACLRAKDPARLLATLRELPPARDREDEAERLLARSRARLETGEPAQALEDARRARTLSPEEPRVLENLGRVSLAAGDAEGAVAAYRAALARAARGAGSPVARARLYRALGEAEERRGRADRAYDAYRRALELDPAEPHAARRVRQMEKAAGLIESPPRGNQP